MAFIINFDILFGKGKVKGSKANNVYRLFLIALSLYFISDTLWGILDKYHLMTALTIDTNFYFITLSFTVLLWMCYTILFLGSEKNRIFSWAFFIYGCLITLFALTVIIINFFNPILFGFDTNNVYYSKPIRYVILYLHISVFIISALYAFIKSIIIKQNVRYRYLAIGSFGVVMAVSVIIQSLFPLLPIYAAGAIVAISVFHTFVTSKEKEELLSTRKLVRTDTLTGAGSRYAYVEVEEKIDKLISSKQAEKFAVVVFDINGLKKINDTKGHEYGDVFIQKCYNLINEIYEDVLIYRFGGDEFIAIISGKPYDKREELFDRFNAVINENLINRSEIIISSGMSIYNKDEDNSFRAVFVRADNNMYARKKELKTNIKRR